MPVHIEKRDGRFCVIEPDGSVVKCHQHRHEALDHMRAINANVEKEDDCCGETKATMVDPWDIEPISSYETLVNSVADWLWTKQKKKVQGGVARSAGEYLCVPDRNKPSTWKLPKTDSSHKVTAGKLGQIAAALSPGGHRGQPVDLPPGCSRASMISKLRAEYRKLGKEPPESLSGKAIGSLTVHKDKDGVWYWLGVISNNWIDRHDQWITAKAHADFVSAIESGEYSERLKDSWLMDLSGRAGQIFSRIAERGTPDLWLWHLPVPIGYALDVAFDDRGYVIGMGKQYEDGVLPYDEIFQTLNDMEPGELGMSHGMPTIFMNLSLDEREIHGYLDTEFTALPASAAANPGTGMVVLKEATMQIPEHKARWIKEKFGDKTFLALDEFLGQLEIFAEETDIPRKEKGMEDVTKADEALEAATEETEAVAEVEEAAESEAPEVADVASDDASEGEADEEVGTGMAMDPAGFKVPTDLREFADEITAGLKEVVLDLRAENDAKLEALRKELEAAREEIAKLKEADSVKFKAKAEETPVASLRHWLAGEVKSVIGTDEARIHGNQDRALWNKTKHGEEEPDVPVPGVPSSIAKMIQRQRNNIGAYRVGLSLGDED